MLDNQNQKRLVFYCRCYCLSSNFGVHLSRSYLGQKFEQWDFYVPSRNAFRRPAGGNRSRQDGNIRRLRNSSDEEDENATWNGNSTQQMWFEIWYVLVSVWEGEGKYSGWKMEEHYVWREGYCLKTTSFHSGLFLYLEILLRQHVSRIDCPKRRCIWSFVFRLMSNTLLPSITDTWWGHFTCRDKINVFLDPKAQSAFLNKPLIRSIWVFVASIPLQWDVKESWFAS